MTAALAQALASYWRRHPLELATLLVGLMVATALWSGVQALNAEARRSYAEAAGLVSGGARIVAADGQRLPLSDYVALRRAGLRVSPVLEGEWRAGDVDLHLVGVEPMTLPRGAAPIGEEAAALPAFVLPPGRAFAAPATIARLAGRPGLPELVASGQVPEGTLLLDIGRAAGLLGLPDRVSYLLAPAGTGVPPAFADRLTVAEGPADDLARLTDSFHLNLTAFGFLSFLVGLIIVYAAIGLAFERRRPMLRTLRALGVPARGLALALLAEILALALLGGAAGMAGGYLMAAALLPDVAASLNGLYGAHVPGRLALDPAWWLAGLGIATFGALAAAGDSLWRAFHLGPLAAARPEAWLGALRRRLVWQAGAAVLLCALALALLLLGGSLLAGFALMGALLLGAALLLPGLLALVLAALGRRAKGPVAHWLFADGRQRLGGLSLALMALLLALGVNVGVGTMVSSFRATFLGWLDQRLGAEIYLSAPDGAAAEVIGAALATTPGVTAALPIGAARSRFAGAPLEIYAFTDDPLYREGWPLLAALDRPWDRVAAGDAVMVNEQMARRAGLAPGDALAIPTATGAWETRVAGVYSDYGNPEAQVLAPVAQVRARWPELELRRLAVRADPASVPALLADLRGREGVDVTDRAGLRASAERVFEKTFAVTLALNTLTLIVAGIALLTGLLTLAEQRLGQLAPLWALGLTRRRLAAIELGQAVALAGLTALAALPLGLAVAWVLTEVINPRAFGWRLPLLLFPLDWARLFLFALATGALAALWPALRLARAAPADLIRRFSDER
ncbi:FtsX-like permease family protein [Amaricoccus solimangrovi]|uniref:FtsX-like permease family protein n=1 Tax=Amaricoccus solimangrovi TaxID=2589815 RepID=A0A501X0U8_9RHOB|nr:FtsX-like permease family protein [Amaricoccus solimangrovi]TPE53611.1 FtsX-like permease family protein [Amaricoccus solimangrovi]